MDRVIKEIFDVVYAPWIGILPPLLFAVYAAIRWRGRWRVLAQIPLLVDIVFFAGLIGGQMENPDPDGIGLSLIIVFVPLSILWVVYLLILFFLRERHVRMYEQTHAAGKTGGL